MTTINRAAEGLLSLLDLKQLGVNPQQLGQTVAPVLNVREHYTADMINVVRASQAYAAIGNFAQITVPATEAWLVYGVQAHAICGLGGNVRVSPLLGMANGMYLAEGPALQALNLNDIATESWWPPQPIVFPPGTDFFCSILQQTTPGTALLNILRATLRI